AVRHFPGLDAPVAFVLVVLVLVVLILVVLILVVGLVLWLAFARVQPVELFEFVAASEFLGNGYIPHGGPFAFLAPEPEGCMRGRRAASYRPHMIVTEYQEMSDSACSA